MGIGLSSQATSERMRGQNQLLHGSFKNGLDIRRNFSTDRVIKHWNRLSRKLVESPSLELFKERLDMALSAKV